MPEPLNVEQSGAGAVNGRHDGGHVERLRNGNQRVLDMLQVI